MNPRMIVLSQLSRYPFFVPFFHGPSCPPQTFPLINFFFFSLLPLSLSLPSVITRLFVYHQRSLAMYISPRETVLLQARSACKHLLFLFLRVGSSGTSLPSWCLFCGCGHNSLGLAKHESRKLEGKGVRIRNMLWNMYN